MLCAAGAACAGENEILYQQRLDPYPLPILVPATIDGNSYPLMLDTGATVHMFDPALRRFLGPLRQDKIVQTVGGSVDIAFFDAPGITMGHWDLPDSKVGILDCNAFRTHLGSNVRGMIGVSVLRQCALWLDFDHSSLKILQNVTPPAAMAGLKLSFNSGGVPCVKWDVRGQIIELMIDTGDNSCIGLRHDTFLQLVSDGTIALDRKANARSETANGQVTQLSGRFTKGRLLGMNLTGVPVGDRQESNFIGVGFLLNFNVIVDLQGARLLYQQRKAMSPIQPGVMLGIGFTFPEGRARVDRLAPAGPAARAGIREGDRIARLGPLQQSDLNIYSIYELCLNHARESLPVEILRPGEVRPIVTRLKLPDKIFEYPPRELR